MSDPHATGALADACCRLPLALRAAAELAYARPATAMSELAGELADRRRGLGLFGSADSGSDVSAVFSWSYQRLTEAGGRGFRLAGLVPGRQLDQYSAAALLGTTPDQSRLVLSELARAHLIQPAGTDRYAMHALLRDYARDLAATQDDDFARRAALRRLADYYLHTAAMTVEMLLPQDHHGRSAT